MSSRRVLVVSDVSGWMAGGVPAETRHLLAGLVARGHAVGYAGDVPLGGAEVAHFAIDVPTHSGLPTQLQAALDRFRPDVVHVMAMGSRGLARIAPILEGLPWLCTCHSVPPHERKIGIFHAHERLHYAARALRFAANALAWRWLFAGGSIPHVVVHSAFVHDVVIRYGAAPERVTTVPLGADPPQAAPAPARAAASGPILLTVAGVAHTKGQHDAIAALPAIAERCPDVRYVMVGEVRDASYAAFLDRLAERLGVAPRVQRLQGLTQSELASTLREADLYLQPSHEEGFCLAFIEAAAVVPRLVGSATGAIASIAADDPDMRVVPARAPALLAGAALELLGRAPDADAMRRRAQRLQDRFSWSRYLDAHETLYARVGTAASRRR